MRAALIPTPDLAYESGSTLFTRYLLSELAPLGWSIDVFCQTAPEVTIDGVSFHQLAMPLDYPVPVHRRVAGEEFAESFSLLVDGLRRLNPDNLDVVHAFYGTFTALAASAVRWFWDKPVVLSTFGRDIHVGSTNDTRYRSMLATALSVADHVTVPTDMLARELVESHGLKTERVTVLPSGVDGTAFDGRRRGRESVRATTRARLGLDDEMVVCVAVQSAFNHDKGLDLAIEAFRCVVDMHPEARLLVAGRDDLPDQHRYALYSALIDERGLGAHVRLLGAIPHIQLPELLAAADIFVDPRRSGNFSSSLLEAVCSGVPAVATDLDSNRLLVKDDLNGRLIECEAPRALATALRDLVGDASMRERLRRGAYAWFDAHRDDYSFDRLATRVDRIYRQVST